MQARAIGRRVPETTEIATTGSARLETVDGVGMVTRPALVFARFDLHRREKLSAYGITSNESPGDSERERDLRAAGSCARESEVDSGSWGE